MISSVSLCYSCIVSPAYFHNLAQKFITQQPAVWLSHTRSPIHTLLPPSQYRDGQRKFLPLYASHTVWAEINCLESRKKDSFAPLMRFWSFTATTELMNTYSTTLWGFLPFKQFPSSKQFLQWHCQTIKAKEGENPKELQISTPCFEGRLPAVHYNQLQKKLMAERNHNFKCLIWIPCVPRNFDLFYPSEIKSPLILFQRTPLPPARVDSFLALHCTNLSCPNASTSRTSN